MNEYVAKGREIVQAAPELYIDIDVEADGIAGMGSLLSIGAVDPWGEGFYCEIKPDEKRNGFLPEYRTAMARLGIDLAHFERDGIGQEQAMHDFAEWVEQRKQATSRGNAVLVAYNASYDFPLVNLAFHRAGIESPFGHAGYCIKSLAMALRPDEYSWKQTSKGKLPAEIVPAGDFTHNALDDARYQQHIHHGLVGMMTKV